MRAQNPFGAGALLTVEGLLGVRVRTEGLPGGVCADWLGTHPGGYTPPTPRLCVVGIDLPDLVCQSTLPKVMNGFPQRAQSRAGSRVLTLA